VTDSNPPAIDPLADRMPYRIVRPYRVRFEESTAAETMRTAVQLAWVADCAWQHSAALGLGREWYTQHDLFWLVRSVRLEVLRPIATYASVMVSTQVVGYRRIACRRESELFDDSGQLLGRAEIDWVMTNERGMPTRVPTEFYGYAEQAGATFEMLRANLPKTPPSAAERRFDVRRRDLDPLDHVNNSVYVDYLDEALEAAGQGELLRAPRCYVLDYAAAAARGETIVDRCWPLERGWAYRICREDGSELFRATIQPLT
jgi:acyl-ACP thioesterase